MALSYYVDYTAGNDGNPGTLKLPFKTIEAARNVIRAALAGPGLPTGGAVVYLRGGTHPRTATFTLTAADNTSATKPIVYRGYPGETVILSAGTTISGPWEELNGAHQVTTALEFNSLFVNGARATRARLPKTGYYRIKSVDPATNLTAFRFNGNDIKPTWSNLTDVEIVGLRCWHQSRLRIATVVGDLVTFGTPLADGRGYDWDYSPITQSRYWVENCREAVTSPGDWYLDRAANKLLYYPLQGQDIEQITVIAPTLTQFINVSGADYTTFRDLQLWYGDWAMNEDGYIGGQAASTAYEDSPAAIHLNDTDGITLQGLRLKYCGGAYAIFMYRARYTTIRDCEIDGATGGGIQLYNATLLNNQIHHNTIENNAIHDSNSAYLEPPAILCMISAHNRISGNHCYNGTYTGISVGWVWNASDSACHDNTIEDNVVHDYMTVLNDGGGIYLLGKQPGTIVQRNTFYDIKLRAGEQYHPRGIRGIYFDQGANSITVYGNLVYRCTAGLQMYTEDADNNLVDSNIFVDCDKRVFEYTPYQTKDSRVRSNVIFCANQPTSIMFFRVEHYTFVPIDSPLSYYLEPVPGCFTEHDYNVYWYLNESEGEEICPGEPDYDPWNLPRWQAEGYDEHSLLTDPLLANYVGGDYRIMPNSPAIALGFSAEWLIYRDAGVHSTRVNAMANNLFKKLRG